jgi:Zn-dependent protease with chaperone function
VIGDIDAPELHAWVRRLAALLGTPAPCKIHLDFDVNATARPLGGVLDALVNRQFVLTLGLPLAACLDTTQLAAVVGHELGHFAQRGRTLAGHVLYLTHNRLARDYRADLQPTATMARACALGERLIARHMEYAADRHAARLVGSDAAEEALLAIAAVEIAADQAWVGILHLWQHGRSPSDLAGFIAEHYRRHQPALFTAARAAIERGRSPWHARRPTYKQRIAKLRWREVRAMYWERRAVSEVLGDFEGLCKRATGMAWSSSEVARRRRP